MHVPLTLNLTITKVVLEWGLNFDPSLRWKARGLSGHKEDRQEEVGILVRAHEEVIAAHDAGQVGNIPESSFEILKRAMSFFGMVRDGADLCDQVFPKKVFNFILGVQRSGGTYLMKQILEAHEIDIYSIPMPLILDDIPRAQVLLGANKHADMNLQCFYQFLQFLAISETVFQNKPIIVNKNIFLVYWLRYIDSLIGKQSNYILTIRDPFECFISFREFISLREKGELDVSMGASHITKFTSSGGGLFHAVNNFKFISIEDWDSLDGWKQFLLYWETYYSNISKQFPLAGNIIPAVYGNGFQQVVNQLTPKSTNRIKINLSSRDRNYSELQYKFGFKVDDLVQAHERVSQAWLLAGIEFPSLEKIQSGI